MKKYLFTLLTLLSASAQAFMPTPGLWYNPAESGRGWTIDYQNETMVVASYVFDPAGHPIWYLSSGTYDEKTATFTGTLDSGFGGQCFGCPYTKPAITVGAGGTMTLVFKTIGTATVAYPGGSSPLVHFVYGFDTSSDPKQNLAGEWILSYASQGSNHTDWVIFDSTYTAGDGTRFVAGHVDGDAAKVALGTYDIDQGYLILVSASVSGYNHLYRLVTFDNVRATGLGYEQTPAGFGLPHTAFGHRALTKTQLDARGGLVILSAPAANPKYAELANALKDR